MSNTLGKRVSGTKLLLSVLVSFLALSTSYANAQGNASSNAIEQNNALNNTIRSDTAEQSDASSSTTMTSDADEPDMLSCQSVRCRNRQHRRIFRANCRLQGGIVIGHTCRINDPEGGN